MIYKGVFIISKETVNWNLKLKVKRLKARETEKKNAEKSVKTEPIAECYYEIEEEEGNNSSGNRRSTQKKEIDEKKLKKKKYYARLDAKFRFQDFNYRATNNNNQ